MDCRLYCRLYISISKPLQVTFDVVPASTVDVAIGDAEGVGGIIYARPASGLRVTTLINDVS